MRYAGWRGGNETPISAIRRMNKEEKGWISM